MKVAGGLLYIPRGGDRRSGFTLVELLVVVSIISMLIALLLPAVQAAREAARQMQCANHLKQIGLGCLTYHDIHAVLPDGGKNGNVTPVNPDVPNCDSSGYCCSGCTRGEWAWTYQILPFVEQEVLYAQAKDNTIHTSPVVIYYCPTRRRAALYNNLAKCDYAGSAGDSLNAPGNGAFVGRKMSPAVSLADIRDGTSNTLLVAEKQTNPNYLGSSGGDNESYVNPGWNDCDVIRNGAVANPPARDAEHPAEPPVFWSYRFGSSHAGTFNGVLVDGSVHSYSFGIHAETFRLLCVRNDGKTIQGLP